MNNYRYDGSVIFTNMDGIAKINVPFSDKSEADDIFFKLLKKNTDNLYSWTDEDVELAKSDQYAMLDNGTLSIVWFTDPEDI